MNEFQKALLALLPKRKETHTSTHILEDADERIGFNQCLDIIEERIKKCGFHEDNIIDLCMDIYEHVEHGRIGHGVKQIEDFLQRAIKVKAS